MNPYDTYGWQDDESQPVYSWDAIGRSSRVVSPAGPFTGPEDAAQQLAVRRKAMPGHTISILRDGETWEPGE